MEVIDAYPTGQQNSVESIGVTCNCGHFSVTLLQCCYNNEFNTIYHGVLGYIRLLFLLLARLRTSTVTSTVPVLHPYFITGFADAESCFYVRVTKKNNMKLG